MLRRVIMLALFLIGSAVVVTRGTPSKAKADEQRINRAVAALTTANGNLQDLIAVLDNAFTTTNGLNNGTINGTSATGALNDGTIGGQSGPQIGGASAHVHGGGSYAVNDGHHGHGGGSYAVDDGTHAHQLPNL